MNPVQSSIKRFIFRLSLAILVILTTNVFIFGIYIYFQQKSISAEIAIIPLLKRISKELVLKDTCFYLDSDIQKKLDNQNMWAMLLDDRKGTVLWSYKLPKEIPTDYTLSDIAFLSRYYLKDYPVSTWKHPNGLIVLGSPKFSLWKIAYMFPYPELKKFPYLVILVVICDLFILTILYLIVDRKSINAVSNVLFGIQSLADGKPVRIKEVGTFSEIAAQLNKASDLLQKRTLVQENWIAGISHDIRTPLSVILGYADKIETNLLLPKDIKEKALIIKLHGIRLRDMVNDLTLITRLGDETQPVRKDVFQPAALCREIVASLLNNGIPENYSIELDINKELESVTLNGDTHLLQRAINNILYNSIRHNPKGCDIYFSIYKKEQKIFFVLSDNGKGMSSDEIDILQNRSHYISNGNCSINSQHGLGLYIVQQIVKMHFGNVYFNKSESGGMEVQISLPI